jgi:stage II sporulation protein AB (anti-sigma F factor)
MKTPLNEIRLQFLSRSSNEAFIRSAVAAFCAPADPTLEELGDIKTAVSEAVTNCIVHAYPDSLGWITVRARLFEDGVLELVIRDKGRGIENIDAARTPMFTTGGAERSGMGFTIMESFMDLVRVRSIPGKGTALTLRRRLRSRGIE